MSGRGRAVELVVVVSVLGVLLLLSLQSAATQVAGALQRAERSQAALDAAALAQERAVNGLLGEQVVVAQVSQGLPETPAVRAGRALVAAAEQPLPPLHVPVAALAGVLLLRALQRGHRARRRRALVQRSAVVLSAFSASASRCGVVDARGTVLQPVR